LRIIGGKFKGRKLVTFTADHIRPTSDRVKESLFNILMTEWEGARVLDLFSGTGNLALEALSRGASQVVAVESHKKSLEIIEKNISHLGVKGSIELRGQDVFAFLQKYSGVPFEIVLVDPPFTKALADSVMVSLSTSATLHPSTIVAIESSRKEKLIDQYGSLYRYDRREYRDKTLSFFRQGDST